MRVRFVDNIMQFWRWWSLRFAAAALAAEAIWISVPPEVLAEFLTEVTQRRITAGLILAAMVARVIDQGTSSKPEDQA